MSDLFQELQWRELIHSYTPGIEEHLKKGPITGYIGFDPTAPSLHVGSLLPILELVHLQRHGHTPIAVAGGGTGMIGDPSGKTQERKLLSNEELEVNLEGIKKQLEMFLDFNSKTNPAKLVNNADWLTKLSLMDFLREYGKYFSVNEMLAKDSVKSRLEKEQGISFTEFSYAILQSYDFLVLYDRYNCTLQMGGSDQWGNITSGIDLVRRCRGVDVYGIVSPLITTSTGVKFGKTESGTIWLDSSLTSPYKFYQFWLNTDDRDVIKYLKYFTFLEKDEIESYESALRNSPEKREAQHLLAREVTLLVHGESELKKAMKASRIFFGGEITDISQSELLDIFSDVPSTQLAKDKFSGSGMPIIELLLNAQVVKSKSEARRLIQSGGIYLNNRRISELEKNVTLDETIHGKFLVLRKGIKNYFLVQIVD